MLVGIIVCGSVVLASSLVEFKSLLVEAERIKSL